MPKEKEALPGQASHRAEAAAGHDGAQAVGRATALLFALAEAPKGDLSLTELSGRCALNLSTTRRIAAALVSSGLVAQDPASRRYFLGAKCIRLGTKAASHFGIDLQVVEAMMQLAAHVGEGVNLGVLDDAAVLYVEKIESPQALGINLPAGTRVPLYCTSIGKMLLAESPPHQREALLEAQTFEALQQTTITSRSELEGELDLISQQGYAIDNGEFLAGVTCMSVPLRRRAVTVAALAIQCPTVHHDGKSIVELLPELRAAAARIESLFEAVPADTAPRWHSNGQGQQDGSR